MKNTLLSTLRRKALPALLLSLAAASTASAHTVTYSYYRFRATALRNDQPIIQLSEFDLFNSAAGATPLVPATATDSTGDNSGDGAPGNAIDIGNYNSKWLNFDYQTGYLILGFSSPQPVDSYNYYTGNDETDRDPVAWVLEGSNDSAGPWTIVDAVNNFAPATSRSTIATATNFVIPDSPPGVITEFSFNDNFQSNIVTNGSSVAFFVDAVGQTITLSSSAGGAPVPVTTSTVTVTPPNNAYTTYTLTAHSASGESTRSLSVRTVPAPKLTYRYVRYTPLTVAAGSTISLNDLSFKNAGVRVPVAAVENPGGNSVAPTAVANLVDDPVVDASTEYRSVLSPVILDFGSAPVAYDSFSFTTGSDPDLRPLRWLIEGSNDKTAWSLVQNVNFDFNSPRFASSESPAIPFDGSAVVPFVSLKSDAVVTVAGDPIHLTYSVLGATSGTLLPGPVTLSGSGVYTVNPTANTSYTLTATTANGTAQAGVAQVVLPSVTSSFTFPNFEDSTLIRTVGNSKVLNDFAHFTAAGNVKRLRLTEDLGSQRGAAWYLSPIVVKNGFDTSFDAFIATSAVPYGADGLAFVVQNTPAGLAALNGNQVHLSGNAVSVTLDSFPDVAGESGYASLEIWKGDALATVVGLPALSLAHGGQYLADFNKPAANPYHVRVVYTPPATAGANGGLTVYVDSTKVIDSFPVSLESAGAVDANGRAYVGFLARTGGFTEVHDITSWSLTTAGSTGTSTPLAITSFNFNTAGHTLTLNHSATAGKTYRVTTSTDLVTWTQAAGTTNTVAASTTGSFTVNYTAAAKGFFRVEQLDP